MPAGFIQRCVYIEARLQPDALFPESQERLLKLGRFHLYICGSNLFLHSRQQSRKLAICHSVKQKSFAPSPGNSRSILRHPRSVFGSQQDAESATPNQNAQADKYTEDKWREIVTDMKTQGRPVRYCGYRASGDIPRQDLRRELRTAINHKETRTEIATKRHKNHKTFVNFVPFCGYLRLRVFVASALVRSDRALLAKNVHLKLV